MKRMIPTISAVVIAMLKSKAFFGFGIVFVLGLLLMLLEIESWNDITGYESFLRNCNNLNSVFVLGMGIYSGIHVATAFEERKIQAAVMAGNSRLNIILAKLLSFSIVIAIYTLVSVGISSVIGFLLAKEMGTGSLKTVIIQIVLFTFAQIALHSICFVISMIVKKLGTAIALNSISLIALNVLYELFLEKKYAEPILKFIPATQVYLSLENTGISNMLISIIVSAFGILSSVFVTYVLFRKNELK